MAVQDIIKSRRKELKLTLKEVADKLHVSEGTVSRYESGDIQNMGIDKIAALARVLECSPGYLMGWEDTPNNPAASFGPIDAQMARLLKYYELLNEEGRNRLLEQAQFFASQDKYKEIKTGKDVG